MKLRRTAAEYDPSPTGRMIDAAMDNRSQLQLRTRLRPSTHGKVSVFVSTALGKVVLCSTVAAASIGSVALTTDRIDLEPSAADQPPVTSVPSAFPPPPSTTVTEPTSSTKPTSSTEPLTTTAVEPDITAATDEPPMDPAGCDSGQATADAASARRKVPDEHPVADHDPCDRSRNPTQDGPPGRSTADEPDADPSDNGNAGGNGNRNRQGNGKPAR